MIIRLAIYVVKKLRLLLQVHQVDAHLENDAESHLVVFCQAAAALFKLVPKTIYVSFLLSTGVGRACYLLVDEANVTRHHTGSRYIINHGGRKHGFSGAITKIC